MESKKIKIEIKHWWTGCIIFTYESASNTVLNTVKEAIKAGANLSGADLSGANLRSANLRSADLSGADLSGADLRSADLRSADLSGADLRSADLSGADLRSADLRSADLSGADLRSANLRSADLRSADLSGADLSGADLEPIKNDLFIVLLHSIPEIEFLRENIIKGNINGSTYDGDCACLSGTLANGCIIHNGPKQKEIEKLILKVRDSERPIERFFLGINKGDTPENNQHAKLALQWIDEFKSLIGK